MEVYACPVPSLAAQCVMFFVGAGGRADGKSGVHFFMDMLWLTRVSGNIIGNNEECVREAKFQVPKQSKHVETVGSEFPADQTTGQHPLLMMMMMMMMMIDLYVY